MKILISNDDGVHAEGLQVLAKAIRRICKDAIVVAPLEEKSTTGHSLTLHKPLRIISITGQKNTYGINGSPADCVYIGMKEILKHKPGLVISGINRGSNMGQDVYYSGTVSAAREACIMGIPSLAVSLSCDTPKSEARGLYFESAANYAVQLIRMIQKHGLPKHTLMNLNVPNRPLKQIKGIKTARLGFRYYGGKILKRKDHRGKPYYWIGGQYQGFLNEKETDCHAVEEGYAAITPLKLDGTDYSFFRQVEGEWLDGK